MDFETAKKLYGMVNNPSLSEYFSEKDYQECVKDPEIFQALGEEVKTEPLAQSVYSKLKENYLALNALGVYYSKKDPKKARKYFLKAIKRGSDHAKHNLAKMYCLENPSDPRIAALGKESLEAGIIPSATILGFYYFALDPQKAIFYFDQDLRDPGMAYFYISKVYNFTGDRLKEKEYLKKAKDAGSVEAVLEIAKYYQANRSPKAEKYFLLAAELKGEYQECAVYYCKILQYKKAEPFFIKAIKKGDSRSLEGFLECLVGRNLYSDAINLIEEYSWVDPKVCKNYLCEMIGGNFLSEKEYQLFMKWPPEKFYDLVLHTGTRLLYKIYREKIDLIGLPFAYAPGQEGFQEAKEDFDDNMFIQSTSTQ